jgi:integrative and conjugative element protein (TIGR02256 family)
MTASVSLPRALLIDPATYASATSRAIESMPFETGGVCLGYRADDFVVVTELVHVPPLRAHRRSYRRRRKLTVAAVEGRISGIVGYVGEWHTHPKPEPPSGRDCATLAGIARWTIGPVGLLVLAVNGETITGHALVAARTHTWPIAAIDAVAAHHAALVVEALPNLPDVKEQS